MQYSGLFAVWHPKPTYTQDLDDACSDQGAIYAKILWVIKSAENAPQEHHPNVLMGSGKNIIWLPTHNDSNIAQTAIFLFFVVANCRSTAGSTGSLETAMKVAITANTWYQRAPCRCAVSSSHIVGVISNVKYFRHQSKSILHKIVIGWGLKLHDFTVELLCYVDPLWFNDAAPVYKLTQTPLVLRYIHISSIVILHDIVSYVSL